jgi:hypothetical protein
VAFTLMVALFSNLFILPSILLSFERKTSIDPEYEPALELSAGFDDEEEGESREILNEEKQILEDSKD